MHLLGPDVSMPGVASLVCPEPYCVVSCVQGVIVYFRVVDGRLKAGDDIRLMNTQKEFEVLEVGALAPKPVIVSPQRFLLLLLPLLLCH